MTILYTVISLLIILVLVGKQKNYWKENKILNLSLKREIAICLVLIGLSFTSIEIQKEKALNHIEFEIGSLGETDINQINFIDRNMAGRWDINSKDNGKIFKNIAIYLLPLSLLFFTGNIKSRLTLFFVFSQGYILTESLTGLTKGLVNRYRPFAYRSLQEIEKLSIESKEKFFEDIVDYDIKNSFFSGDASILAFGFMFFAVSHSSFYNLSKYKPLVWAMAIIGTILGCYFRSLSGKHFPTDVILGALVGGLIAFGIVKIHKNN